jgi:hypothetical protein
MSIRFLGSIAVQKKADVTVLQLLKTEVVGASTAGDPGGAPSMTANVRFIGPFKLTVSMATLLAYPA